MVPALVYSTTNSRGSIVVTTSPVPTAGPILGNGAAVPTVITTTDSLGNEVVLSSVTSGAVITTTDNHGHTLTTTYYPAASAIRSIVLETIILPNGQQSVITSYAIVVPTGFGAVTQDQAASATRTSTQKPGLQTAAANVARKVSEEMLALAGGALGLAWML